MSDLPALVFEKTEGNPLFMADLVRYLQKRGSLAAEARTGLDVPNSLRVLIDRTLQSLPPAARQVASIAAVQGHEFDSATLARVSGMLAADVEELLGRLEDAHALIALERETAFPDGTLTLVYRFVHVLYQDALIDSTIPSKRIEWARRIGEALMLAHAGRTDHVAGQIAALLETGRDFWQASQHFLAASRNATQRFAFREAIELATRGPHVSERGDRRRTVPSTAARAGPDVRPARARVLRRRICERRGREDQRAARRARRVAQ